MCAVSPGPPRALLEVGDGCEGHSRHSCSRSLPCPLTEARGLFRVQIGLLSPSVWKMAWFALCLLFPPSVKQGGGCGDPPGPASWRTVRVQESPRGTAVSVVDC